MKLRLECTVGRRRIRNPIAPGYNLSSAKIVLTAPLLFIYFYFFSLSPLPSPPPCTLSFSLRHFSPSLSVQPVAVIIISFSLGCSGTLSMADHCLRAPQQYINIKRHRCSGWAGVGCKWMARECAWPSGAQRWMLRCFRRSHEKTTRQDPAQRQRSAKRGRGRN